MWPWDWVIAAGNKLAGVSKDVYDWVSSLIASVTSWVNDAINSIWHGINQVWADITRVWNTLVAFVSTLAAQVWGAIARAVDQLTSWALRLINDIWGYLRGLYDWIVRQIDRVWHDVLALIDEIYRWVKKEIWDPLVRLYNDIKDWVEQWIARIWQYIEHPELLVQLIGSFLLRMWTQYVLRFGSVIVRWLLHHMTSMAGEVFDMLESIISSVL